MSEENVIETIPLSSVPVKLGVTKSAIKKLQAKYKVVPDATTPEGYKAIKKMKAELVPLRTGVEAERKIQVASALAHQKRINSSAKEITQLLVDIEMPWYEAKRIVDEAEETKKREAEEKETARIELIEERIKSVNELVNGLLGANSIEISAQLKIAENILTSSFEEFEDVAIESRDSAIKTLQKALDEKILFETQQAAQASLNKKMEEQQARLDEQQAKLDAEENERMIKVREENAAKEAAEKATKDAELAAQVKIDEANERERMADEQVKQAKKEAAETEARVKRESDEKIKAEKEEAEKREANKKHKAKINNEALSCLYKIGIDEEDSKDIIVAISKGEIKNIKIFY